MSKQEFVSKIKSITTEDLKADACRFGSGAVGDEGVIEKIAMELQSRLGVNSYTNRIMLRLRDGKCTPFSA